MLQCVKMHINIKSRVEILRIYIKPRSVGQQSLLLALLWRDRNMPGIMWDSDPEIRRGKTTQVPYIQEGGSKGLMSKVSS